MSLTKDDVNLLRGHAEFLRMEGKTDMPAAFDRLALTIERHIAAGQQGAGCAACGDDCKERGSCRLADESPNPAGACRAVDDGVHSWSDPAVHGKVECLFCGDVQPKPAGAVPLPETHYPDSNGDMWLSSDSGITLWVKADDAIRYGDAREAAWRAVAVSSQIVGWVHEDQLPDGYPYDAMFPYSKVDGVRMFPVFAPAPAADAGGVTDEIVERAATAFITHNPGREAVLHSAMRDALTAALAPEVRHG